MKDLCGRVVKHLHTPGRSGRPGVILLLSALLTVALAGCDESALESSWLGVIVGIVEGEDVGPEIGLSSLGLTSGCDGVGRAIQFAVHPDEQGRFRVGLNALNLGPSPRCFDMVVDRDGTPFDTIRDLGPANMFEYPPLDSLFLRIRVFASDSAVVLESLMLPGGGS